MCFNPDSLFLFGLAYTGRESKKMWINRTLELEGIDFMKHPQDVETLLTFDPKREIFCFQQSLDIDAINKETASIDRKAHLFWEFTEIDAKVKALMKILCDSGEASKKKEGTRIGYYSRIGFRGFFIYDVPTTKKNSKSSSRNESIQKCETIHTLFRRFRVFQKYELSLQLSRRFGISKKRGAE